MSNLQKILFEDFQIAGSSSARMVPVFLPDGAKSLSLDQPGQISLPLPCPVSRPIVRTKLDKRLPLRMDVSVADQQLSKLKLKLSDARKEVSRFEDALAQLTGKPAGETKTKRTHRPSILDEHLQAQILAVMAKSAKEGLNARQLAEHFHQDAIRIRKFIQDNPKLLKRTAASAGTEFLLPQKRPSQSFTDHPMANALCCMSVRYFANTCDGRPCLRFTRTVSHAKGRMFSQKKWRW